MSITSISLTPGMRANLFSLQQTARDFETTQMRLATGLKVNSALDDPVSFFTAQEHRLRASDLAGRKDGMSEAIQTIKAANVGVENINNLIAQAKSLAQSALSATPTDANTFADQYNEVLNQINRMADDADYRGINLLQGAELTVQFSSVANESTLKLTGFGGTGEIFEVAGLSSEMSTLGSNWIDSGTVDVAAINESLANLETARGELRVRSKTLSSNLSIITAREQFTTQMINTLNDGASKLTEADMNEEGANMLMLQTRQALGTTSLSIASQAAQGVLRLF
jgi:flagellin